MAENDEKALIHAMQAESSLEDTEFSIADTRALVSIAFSLDRIADYLDIMVRQNRNEY